MDDRGDKSIEEQKVLYMYIQRALKGSMTVEMSFLMPIILLLLMNSILAAFYFHDKNILAGAAYETAVISIL